MCTLYTGTYNQLIAVVPAIPANLHAACGTFAWWSVGVPTFLRVSLDVRLLHLAPAAHRILCKPQDAFHGYYQRYYHNSDDPWRYSS